MMLGILGEMGGGGGSYGADLIERLINNTLSAQWIRSKIRLGRIDCPAIKSIVRMQTPVQLISCNLTYCHLLENSHYIFWLEI